MPRGPADLIAMSASTFLPSLTLVLLLSLSVETFAQSQTTGGIEGKVRDQMGAVVIQAEVTATSHVTNEERKTKTNHNGDFVLFLLPPGSYRLTITANGFQHVVVTKVVVGITETTRINAELLVGSGPEASLTITTTTDGPTLGRIVDSRAGSELPIAARNYTQ